MTSSLRRRGPWRFLSPAVIRFVLVVLLILAVAAEEYYIFELRNEIEGQNERLRNISVELQTLKNQRNALKEELSSMKKLTEDKGDDKSGDTPERKD